MVQIPTSHFSASQSPSTMEDLSGYVPTNISKDMICNVQILEKDLGESSVMSTLASNALLEEPRVLVESLTFGFHDSPVVKCR